MRKYVTQFVALERNAEKGNSRHATDAYSAFRNGSFEDFYAPLVVDDAELERGLESASLVVDTRLRDALRALGFGETNGDASFGSRLGRREVIESASYAAEYSALPESDIALALGANVDELEQRIAVLENRSLSRLRATVLARGRK
jgi:uncharacterized small protein (DUF1192 family)